MRKSQMEMFGLAIVVILVFIGMLFLIMFYARAPDTLSAKEKYNDQVLAQNLLTAMFKLNTTCSLGIQDMVRDCYLYRGTDQLYKCDNIDSCSYTQRIFDNVLENTLVVWNKPFMMNITGERGLVYSKSNLECLESVPGFHYISLYPEVTGTIETRLDVCR